MTAEDEVEGIEHRFFGEDVGIGTRQEIVFKTKALDVPACTPDRRTIRNTIGRLGCLFLQCSTIAGQGSTEGLSKCPSALVVHRLHLLDDTSHEPTRTVDALDSHFLMVQDEVKIGLLSCG